MAGARSWWTLLDERSRWYIRSSLRSNLRKVFTVVCCVVKSLWPVGASRGRETRTLRGLRAEGTSERRVRE